MSGIEFLAVLAALVTISSVAGSVAKAWAERAQVRRPGLPPEVDERLARIEQAVESIEAEVERVLDGLRFTTKLLAQRADDRAPTRPGRHDAR